MAQIVMATLNFGKLKELREIFRESMVGLEPEDILSLQSVSDGFEVRETGLSFAENALLKAHAAAKRLGMVAIADDSGLSVKILGGAPGIFSARWAGVRNNAGKDRDEANYRLLLAQLEDIGPDHRQAEFVCAAAVAHPDGRERVEYGKMAGVILAAPQEGDGGFGYDPVFCPIGQDGKLFRNSRGKLCSNAELSQGQKNALSHRGQALRKLIPAVKSMMDFNNESS